MKSDRPLAAAAPQRLTRHEQPTLTQEREEEEEANVGKPSWLEPWLEAEEEIYSLPCTD